ncbi:cytochrome P450 [Coprinopsis marcescibilis]|uniref:Cytochrome P450 n=1 Tax=Coprinopsis marcescibilis TaxID=230819 RepID=A0A5C3L730_COPMA|nr:cytochrome P450 [Coprinopsis marcescibilis]
MINYYYSPTLRDLGVLVSAWAVFLCLKKKKRHAYPLPPSPPGQLPLLGHALQIPPKFEWIAYEKWSNELGSDIIYLNALGMDLVIVQSVQMCNDLLDTRSAKYSSRGHFVMVNELMGYDWTMPTLPYGEKWKDQRKLFMRHLSANNRTLYEPRITDNVLRLLSRLLDGPENWMRSVRLMVGGTAFSIAYGIDADVEGDPNIQLASDSLRTTMDALLPGKYFVEFLPILKYLPKWLPGARFHQDALEGRTFMNRIRAEPFAQAEEQLSRGTALPSLTSDVFDGIREAGSDTTVASVDSFILAMLIHPEIQKKARDEIDSVVGTDRLPELADERDLPYLCAAIKELFRWRPVSGIVLPHKCTEDDVYQGYFIPKDTLIIPNQKAMLYNTKDYPNPEIYNPERFLTEDGKPKTDILDPYDIAFGFGRRKCPGFHVALATTFMTAASILSLFEIQKPLDEDGFPIEPSMDVIPGITSWVFDR